MKSKRETVPPKVCPECGGALQVKGFASKGIATAYCVKCNITSKGHEHPEITAGKRMAEDFIDVPVMHPSITRLSTNTQIGILRKRQHCGTCGALGYNCKCKDCNCVCCQEYKQ